MFDALTERWIAGDGPEGQERRDLLARLGLAVPATGDDDRILGIFDASDRLIGTGALAGATLQGIGALPECRDEGVASRVVSALVKEALRQGKTELYVFTKPETAPVFEALSFDLVVRTGNAALLEWSVAGRERGGLAPFLSALSEVAAGRPGGAGAAVVNANPFTLGHRYLLETAAARTPHLYVLVVEEDRSVFPFDLRFSLVRDGTADLANVTVLRGGAYVISSRTFPSYFTRDDAVAQVHATLDATLFAERIAPALRVTERFVGTEPYCPVTKTYNEALKRVLPPRGVRVTEIPRVERDGEAVSASRVRALIREGRLSDAKALLPATTYDALAAIERRKESDPESAALWKRITLGTGRH